MVNPTRVLPRHAQQVPAPITPAPVPQTEATTDPRRQALRQANFAQGEQMLSPNAADTTNEPAPTVPLTRTGRVLERAGAGLAAVTSSESRSPTIAAGRAVAGRVTETLDGNALTAQRGAVRGITDTVSDASTLADAARGNTADTTGVGALTAGRNIVDRGRAVADTLVPEELATSASERTSGYLGAASGVLRLGTGAVRMRDAMNQARAASNNPNPEAMLGAADTGLQATSDLAGGGQTLVNTAARVVDGGRRAAPTGGLGTLSRGLGAGARIANGGRGVLDVARGVTQATRQGANEDEIQAGVVRTGRGALRTLGAMAGPPGTAVAEAGDYLIEAAGDDRATRNRGWLGGRGGSEYATNQGMEVEGALRDTVGARTARVLGMATTAGSSVVGAGANIAAHTADTGDRMANQAMGAMGISGPGSLDIAADAEAEQRLQNEANGQHTPPRSDAAQERRVQAAMARRRAARAAEERRRQAEVAAEAARASALPTTRAADVRAGAVDAAGRPIGAASRSQQVSVNPETGAPWGSDAERNLYQLTHGGL